MKSTRCFHAAVLLSLASVVASSGEWIDINGRSYYVGSTTLEASLTWHTARNWCLSQGGDLTSMTSQEERADVINAIHQSVGAYEGPLWIGLNRLGSGGWRFSDGQQLSSSYWAPGNPIDETNLMPLLCGQTSSIVGLKGLWISSHCDSLASFVCRRNPGASSPAIPVSTITTPVSGYCPSDYIAVGAKCFKIFRGADGGVTWPEAATLCRSQPGLNPDLASISNSYETSALLVGLRDQKLALWIGLRKLSASQPQWLWTDNSALGYTNWASGEPSVSNTELCAEVWTMTASPATWNNADCDIKRGYICQTHPVPGGTAPVTTPNTLCPTGYMFYWFGCYKLHHELKTWNDAAVTCSSEVSGGSLVSIHSPSENAFLQMYILQPVQNSPRMWTGLSYQSDFKYYYWSDSWHVTFTKWASGQPARSPLGGGCVSIDSTSALWYDQMCNETKPFICWKPVQVPSWSDGQSAPDYSCSSDSPSEQTSHNSLASDAPARTTPLPIDGECPSDTTSFSWVAKGSYCYAVSSSSAYWQPAQDMCRAEGGNLASIHDPVEQHFVSELLKAKNTYATAYWMGLVKETDDTFRWTDGNVIDYTNWVNGRPPQSASGSKYCGRVLLTGYINQWDRGECASNYLPYICKAPNVPWPTLPPHVNGSCPSAKWIAYGDMCFLFVPDMWLTADEASDDCELSGGKLATIRSSEENLFVQSQLNVASTLSFPRSYWIGLHRTAGEDEFIWFDEHPVNYTNWQSGSPIRSNRTRLCVDVNGNRKINNEAKWETNDCVEQRNGFVCSIKKSFSPSGPTQAPSSDGSGSTAGTVAGIVIAVLIVLALLGGGVFYYVTKVHIHRQAASAGVMNISYDTSRDEVDSKATDSNAGKEPRRAASGRSTSSAQGGATVGLPIYDNFDDLANYDAEIDRRLSAVRVGRLSFEP